MICLSAKGVLTPRKVAAASALYWIRDAVALFKKQPLLWIIFFLASMMLLMLAIVIPVINTMFIGSFFVLQLLLGGLLLTARKVERGDTIELDSLWLAFRMYWQPFVVLTLIYVFIVFSGTALVLLTVTGTGLTVMGVAALLGDVGQTLTGSTGVSVGLGLFGLGLFVILASLASFFLMGAFYFAPALIVLAGQKPWTAVKISMQATLLNWRAFLLASVLNGLLLWLGALALLVGLIVVIPVIMLSNYTAWKAIFEI